MQKVIDKIDLHIIAIGMIVLACSALAFPLVTRIQVLNNLPGVFSAGFLLMDIVLAPPILTRFGDLLKHRKEDASTYLTINATVATLFALCNGLILMAAQWLFG